MQHVLGIMCVAGDAVGRGENHGVVLGIETVDLCGHE
jgi:hypothetical protein